VRLTNHQGARGEKLITSYIHISQTGFNVSLDWVTVIPILVGVITVILKVLGIFDIIEYVSKWLELKNREMRIEDLEEFDEIRIKNRKDISKFVEVKISMLYHRLSGAAPKIDVRFIIYNRSIFDLNLAKFTYKPQLRGVSGAELDQKEGCSDLSIPPQSSIYFNTYFQIPGTIKDKLDEWRKKGKEGKHDTLTWTFGCIATFKAPIEFKLPLNVDFKQEYYKIE